MSYHTCHGRDSTEEDSLLICQEARTANLKKIRNDVVTNRDKTTSQWNKDRELGGGPLPVGSIVSVAVDKKDRGPGDYVRVTGAVVEVSEHGCHRIVCMGGVLKNVYFRSDLMHEPNLDVTLIGIEEEFGNWKSLKIIDLRSALRILSPIGGQHGSIVCGCQGNCDTRSCKCKKNGRVCQSRCHSGLRNKNCKNCCVDSDSSDVEDFAARKIDLALASDSSDDSMPIQRPKKIIKKPLQLSQSSTQSSIKRPLQLTHSSLVVNEEPNLKKVTKVSATSTSSEVEHLVTSSSSLVVKQSATSSSSSDVQHLVTSSSSSLAGVSSSSLVGGSGRLSGRERKGVPAPKDLISLAYYGNKGTPSKLKIWN